MTSLPVSLTPEILGGAMEVQRLATEKLNDFGDLSVPVASGMGDSEALQIFIAFSSCSRAARSAPRSTNPPPRRE